MTAYILPGCDQCARDAHLGVVAAGGNLATLPPTTCGTTPIYEASAAGCAHDLSGCDQARYDAHSGPVAAGDNLATLPPTKDVPTSKQSTSAAGCAHDLPGCDQHCRDVQRTTVAAGDNLATLPPTMGVPTSRDVSSAAGCAHDLPGCDQSATDAHWLVVAAGEHERLAARAELYDALSDKLLFLAETLSDVEGVRIGMQNRLRQFVADDVASEHEVALLSSLVEQQAKLEHEIVLELRRVMRRHPLGPWVARSKGVGEKQAARMLAAIGNPFWNDAHHRPRRGPAELWAYTGYHVLGDGTAARRRKGQRANWNATAKMRTFLVAESCMKSKGDYRQVYEAGRAKYAELPAGHAHNRALRLVGKAILKDVWREARDWHHA